VEIQAGEGGKDSRDFVHELASVYVRYCQIKGLKTELLTTEDSHVTIQVRGSGAGTAFSHESGQHCIQHRPKNGKGKPHTSLVSVAVLGIPPDGARRPLDMNDVEVKTQCGSQKAGGQHANKTASAVRMTHKPTGLKVFINGRSQTQNKEDAQRILASRVNEYYAEQQRASYDAHREANSCKTGRGGKTRTYNLMDSRVVDHRLNTSTSNVKEVMKGNLDLILKA
jgi:peptide chain release factor 1